MNRKPLTKLQSRLQAATGSFSDRLADWQRRIEDVLIEMENEKTDAGLLVKVDTSRAEKEFMICLDQLMESKRCANENPGKATLAPGNPENHE